MAGKTTGNPLANFTIIPGTPGFPFPPPANQIPPGMSMGLLGYFPADKSVLPYNGHTILGVTSFMTALAVIIVSTRLYVRQFVLKAFGWDDATILAGLLFSIAVMACFIVNVMNGAGRHFMHIQIPEEYERLKHVQYVHITMTTFGILFVKISIGLGMLRILVGKYYRWTAMALMAFVVITTIVTFTPFLAECQPMPMSWAYLKDPTKCIPFTLFKAFADVNGAVSVATDFMYVLLPIPTIWKLQVNRRTKLSLLAVLSVGVLAGGCAVARVITGLAPFNVSDSPWTLQFFIWFAAELNAGLIAASIPPLRPLVSRWLGETTRRFRTGEGSRDLYGNKSGSSATRSRNGWQRQHDVPLSSAENWQKTSRADTSKSAPLGTTTYAGKGSFGDSSQEEILTTSKHDGGIVRSVEITIDDGTPGRAK